MNAGTSDGRDLNKANTTIDPKKKNKKFFAKEGGKSKKEEPKKKEDNVNDNVDKVKDPSSTANKKGNKGK